MLKSRFISLSRLIAGIVWVCSAGTSLAQSTGNSSGSLPLNDLSAFREPGRSWSIAGNVTADLNKANVLHFTDGTGILVNLPSKKQAGTDLFTNFEHGDIDLELDYLMAKGSNSGIYLQGRYELQLEDSWGIKVPTASHNGGIYQRWDDSKPAGQKGYEGYAPRQNVSRAPGLWQHLKISFQAPRFDANGRKMENARMLRVELNGVIIHENVELSGPTRGAISAEEKVTGPLRIQGDHGAVAFRNIVITSYGKPRPELTNLTYAVYKGRFEKEPRFDSIPPEAEGTSVMLTSRVSKSANEFLIRYRGTLHVKEPGEYTFSLNAPGGTGLMKINNTVVIPAEGGRRQTGKINLPAGEMPVELLYSKLVDWAQPSLGIAVIGPGIREYMIGDEGSYSNNVDPILLEASTNTILRSFMDLPAAGNKPPMRVVHAVSVGSPQKAHYTYDMDKGTVVQVWRGDFLDATPMWHSRGDGSSRPVGTVQRFGQPVFTIAKLPSVQTAWVSDTTGSGYRPKGYVLDAQDQPTFRYAIYGMTVNDAIRVLENGQGVQREISLENPSENVYARLAEGNTIELISKDMYIVDDKAYYIQVSDAGGAKAQVRDINGRKELIIPVRGKLRYSILF